MSLRGLSRLYGYDRDFLGALVRDGEVPAVRRGRELRVLRSDFEGWMRRQAIHPREHAEAVADRVLEREARRA